MVVPGRGAGEGGRAEKQIYGSNLRGTAESGFHIGLSSLPKLSPKPEQGNKYTGAFERHCRIADAAQHYSLSCKEGGR